MINGLSFDVEDWFQVENLRGAIARDSWTRQELRVEIGLRRILELLSAANARATFFVLGWIAERRPDLVREIAAAGHEVACHGYGHELVYRMSVEEFRLDLRRAKDTLEQVSGQAVLGYRAPSFSITSESLWAIDVLAAEGLRYDSSVFPVSGHDRYGMTTFGFAPFHWKNGLLEVPLAVYRVGSLALPVAGGGYFRLLPYAYFRFLLTRINSDGRSFAFYLHPWELDPEQPRVKIRPTYAFRHYVNLRRTESRLSRLLQDFKFAPMADVFCGATALNDSRAA